MKKYIILILFGSLSLLGISQKYDNIWTMGYGDYTIGDSLMSGVNIDFSNSPPTFEARPRYQWIITTNASICSPTTGKLLFWSNGQHIVNKQDSVMQGETGFNPGELTNINPNHGGRIPQSVMILPSPIDTNIYYLFHSSGMIWTPNYCPDKFYYSVVDTRLDSGRGAVTELNHQLLNDTIDMGAISACKHANGKDWWVLIKDHETNTYIRFLLQDERVYGPFKQSIGPIFQNQDCANISLFSPDGKKYARLNTCDGKIHLFDFDRCTGLLSNLIVLIDTPALGGIAFSPNSQVLYKTANVYSYQFDLSAVNIQASRTLIATWDGLSYPQNAGGCSFGQPLLAPNGKIYITNIQGCNRLHVIHFPDSLGLSCHFAQHDLYIQRLDSNFPPNYPHFRLGADTTACYGLGIEKEEGIGKEVRLYPNPASDKLTFEFGKVLQTADIAIYNDMGSLVLAQVVHNAPTAECQIAHLGEGIYYYVVNNQITGKFVILR
jgi:hypothetical protein